jgi:putative spermidine/putrescine transport system substrate-binding protein
MNRRSFLIGTGTLALSQALVGCGSKTTLRVQVLKNSIPAQLVNKFRRALKQADAGAVALEFTPEPQLAALFAQLQSWKLQASDEQSKSTAAAIPFTRTKTVPVADLVTLGDHWLAKAIQQQLIQPLDPTRLPGWQQLPPQWQTLVKRDRQGQLDPQGQIWGAPYRWGTTVIAYRVDKFKALGWTPTDWSDLWRPELQKHISLLNQPREVIGLALKQLGQSYNTQDLTTIPALKAKLQALHQQAKFYSSNAYLQPLLLGDTWLAVGWSTDILPLLQHHREIAAVVPQSGTALWADLWVRPATATLAASGNSGSSLLDQWISFCWQPEMAEQLSLLSRAASPMVTGSNRATVSPNLKANHLLLPDEQILQRSEFLAPLPDATVAQYHSLWTEIRQVG